VGINQNHFCHILIIPFSLLATYPLLLYNEVKMQQHPIPQQISSYEFRLVGSMTLKQFLKVAAGTVVAFFLYSSHLPFLIKWPLLLSSAGFGAALAFLPVNERPLETYLSAFFKSIFSPTIYLWQKEPASLDILGTSLKDEKEDKEDEEEEISIPKTPQLNEFLASLPQQQPAPKPKKEKPVKRSPAKTAPPYDALHQPVRFGGLPKTAPPPKASAEAEFGQIPMPALPKTPNILVGMAIDQQGKIIEDAIVEIQDNTGNTNRVLRTDRLGQFRTATPLANGEYLVLVEKEGYRFDIIKIKMEGRVMPPLKIKAKPNPVSATRQD